MASRSGNGKRYPWKVPIYCDERMVSEIEEPARRQDLWVTQLGRRAITEYIDRNKTEG